MCSVVASLPWASAPGISAILLENSCSGSGSGGVFTLVILPQNSKRARALPPCDMVIYNKYILGLHPHSWHRATQTLGILGDESDKGVFWYVNKVTWKDPRSPKDGG